MKSESTYALTKVQGQYFMSNLENSITHFVIQPEISGQYSLHALIHEEYHYVGLEVWT